MLLRIAHELRRGIKAHRLAVEQRRSEHVRVMAFDPGRNIDEQGEARGMAFGKAVLAEASICFEAALGKVCARSRVAVMPSINFVLGKLDRADPLEGRHGAPQLVGFARRETWRHDRDPHRLFLKQRHAEGLSSTSSIILAIG